MVTPFRRRSILLLLPCAALFFGSATGDDLDLMSRGASGTLGAGTFVQTDPQPTGTGIIDPFVRLSGKGQEQGFNTDQRPPLRGDLADVLAGQWTHSVLVGEIAPVDFKGVPSLRFLLDINQTSSSPRLSLDELRIYTSGWPDLDDNSLLSTQNLVYDMGAGNSVFLDYSLNSGSASGDMFLYLPASLFSGLATQYLYLYSKFGAKGGDYASNDGFEEWSHIVFAVPVEESTWTAVKRLYRD